MNLGLKMAGGFCRWVQIALSQISTAKLMSADRYLADKKRKVGERK